MQKIPEIISGLKSIISSIVAFIIALLRGRKDISENLPQKINKQSNIDIGIIQQMEDLKELLNADRVQLYDFHDGERYANGRHAFKTSCTYEVVRVGIKPVQRLLQNIPLSCISKFTAIILDAGFLEVKDLEEIKDIMPSTYQLKTDMNIRGFYDVAICNKEGEVIGFLAVQYIKNKYYCSREEDKQAVLKLKYFIEIELAKTENK